MVRAFVTLPGRVDQWKAVDFLIDTGADITSVHPLTSLTVLGIPPLHLFDDGYWPTVRSSGGVGGGATYYEAPARYAFIREDQTVCIVDDAIFIAKWTEGNQAFPSLLGRNVLRHFRMEIDWFSDAVTFHEP
ncbi:MAG: hypothetical protein ACRDJE_07460 [Dehalococcoidia bacterium]